MRKLIAVGVTVAAIAALPVSGAQGAPKPTYVAPYSSAEGEHWCSALDPNTSCISVGVPDESGRITQSFSITSAQNGQVPNGYFASSQFHSTVGQDAALKKESSRLLVTMAVLVDSALVSVEGSQTYRDENEAEIGLYANLYHPGCECGSGSSVTLADTKTGLTTADGTELVLQLDVGPRDPIPAGPFEIELIAWGYGWFWDGNTGTVTADMDVTLKSINVEAFR